MIRLSSIFLIVFLLGASLLAENSGRSVVLVTIGHGDAVEEQYGHVMIQLNGDPGYGRDVVYHWGLFDPTEDGFIFRFIQGRMMYSMVANPSKPVMEEYQLMGRHVICQQLPLTEPQIDQLIMLCEMNRRPENAKYRYDYYKDNCSTRVRDMLNKVTDGQIAAVINSQSPKNPVTYRQHSVRLMQSDILLSLGMDFVLGPSCDKPLSAWEDCFLPAKLSEYLTPMATKTWSPWQSNRPPEPNSPPDRRWILLGFSVVICAIGLTASRVQRKPINWIPSIITITWWLITGFGGLLMLYLWLATDHEAAYRNQNLFAYSPWNWALLVMMGRKKSPAVMQIVRNLVTATAILSVSALVLHGWILKQDNLQFLLLATPINLMILWFVLQQKRRLTEQTLHNKVQPS